MAGSENRQRRLFFWPAAAATTVVLTAATVARATEPPAPAAPAPAPSPIKVGVDAYLGASDLPGSRRFSDGFWAGSAAAFPSVTYLRWDDEKTGRAARLSVGVGRMYANGSSGGALDQPVEAWVRAPAGRNLSVTAGKFYVPFALSEWEYESKPGVLLAWSPGSGPWSAAASLNHNRRTGRANGYARLGWAPRPELAFGLSLGAGRGLSYDSGHDFAWAADATLAKNGWSLAGEYIALRGGGNNGSASRVGPMRFGFARLGYEGLPGGWKPTLGYYSWRDRSDNFGAFRSAVIGLARPIVPGVTIEAARAFTAGGEAKNVSWVQVHVATER